MTMPRKDPAAVKLGRKGGTATAKNRTPQERSEAARKAITARWDKYRSGLKSAALARLRTQG